MIIRKHLLKQNMWVFLIVIGSGGGWGIALGDDAVEVSSQPDIDQGREIYQAYCVECHGVKGQGDGPGATMLVPQPSNFFSDAISRKTDDELLAVITLGVSGTAMAGWADQLSLDDRRNVLAYIRFINLP